MTIEYLTAGQAARLLGVSPATLRGYVRRSKLRARKIDATTSLYPSDEVEALKACPPRPGRPRKPAPALTPRPGRPAAS